MQKSNVKNDNKLNTQNYDLNKKQDSSQTVKETTTSKVFTKDKIKLIEDIVEYTQTNSIDNFRVILQTNPEERNAKIIKTLKYDAEAEQCNQIIHGMMMCLQVYIDEKGSIRKKPKKIGDVAKDLIQRLNNQKCSFYKKKTLQNFFTITNKLFGEKLLKQMFINREIPPLGEKLLEYTKHLNISIIRHAADTKRPKIALELGHNNAVKNKVSIEYTLPQFKQHVERLEKVKNQSSKINNQQKPKTEKIENFTLNKQHTKLLMSMHKDLKISCNEIVDRSFKKFIADSRFYKDLSLKP